MRKLTLALLGLGLFCNSAAAQVQTPPTTQRSIGQITAVFGDAQIESAGRARSADVFSTFRNDERVRTGDAGLSLVLRTRLVVKLDALTSVRFSEGVGQTHVQLDGGAVQVFAGRRAAYMGDAGVQDALVRMDGKNAVFFASYDPEARSGYYACEHGTITIESAADHRRFTLDADQQAIAAEGKALKISALDRATYSRHQRTLQRLGQSVIAQGSQTQRTRATALDTRNALSQLEAAGWIDRKLLAEARPLSQSSDESEQTTQSQVASRTGSSSSASSETETAQPVEAPAPSVGSATHEPSNPSQSDPSAVPSSTSNSAVVPAPGETLATPLAPTELSTPPAPSEPWSAPSGEIPAPRESTVASVSDGQVPSGTAQGLTPADIQDSGPPSPKIERIEKIEKVNDLPKVKLPKVEKIEKADDPKLDLPKPEKVLSKDNRGKDLPDLKIPKIEEPNSGKGKGHELKEVKDVAKHAREQVEKSNKGKGKKGD